MFLLQGLFFLSFGVSIFREVRVSHVCLSKNGGCPSSFSLSTRHPLKGYHQKRSRPCPREAAENKNAKKTPGGGGVDSGAVLHDALPWPGQSRRRASPRRFYDELASLGVVLRLVNSYHLSLIHPDTSSTRFSGSHSMAAWLGQRREASLRLGILIVKP